MSQITKPDLTSKYQTKGAQKLSYQEYLARKEKAEKSQFKMPPVLKYILAAPLILVSFFGLLFIPYLIFQALTHAPK